MGGIEIALVAAVIGLVFGSYGYTFIVDRIHTRRMETAEENWSEKADAKTKSRDDQMSALRADTMAAISQNNVSLFEHRLHVATNYATTKMQEQMEARFAAMIGKVESKVDRLTDLIKNGH